MATKKSDIPTSKLFLQTKRTMIDWVTLFEHLFLGNTIAKKDVKIILRSAAFFLQNEPNLLYLEDPLTIVGDIHG